MVFFASSAAYAEEGKKGDGKRFAEVKKEILGDISERKAVLNRLYSCVSSTQSKEDMKKCRTSSKAEMEKIRGEAKESRSKRKEYRMERKESRSLIGH